MPSYGLREGLSFCQIDGEVIFLDIHNDRYFRLSDRMEAAFAAFIDGFPQSEAEFASLTKNNILTLASQADGNDASLSTVPLPTESAIELPGLSARFNLSVLLEVAILVLATRWMLKSRRLANIIESLVRHQLKHARRPSSQSATSVTPLVCNAAKAFNHARLYVPVPTSCLLDSIALTKFMSRRRVETNLVFGVTRTPFAAHCWVQAGGLVLNDTVGNVIAHTPIRIV